MADRPTYNRATWDRPIDLGFDAYAPAFAITEQRIRDKRLEKRRPACKLKIRIDSSAHIEIKPKLGSSPTGWLITAIEVALIDLGKVELKADLRPDRTLRLSRWWKNDDRNEVALEELLTALMRFTASPREAITFRASHCGWCGRALSDPQSMEVGIGPECRRGFEQAMRAAEAQMESARPAGTGPSAMQDDLFEIKDSMEVRNG